MAVILTLLIVLNPEFLALGLFGDTAFFDMLVLVLSLQMHMIVSRAWRGCVTALARVLRWAFTPDVGDLFLLNALKLGAANTLSAFRKAFRISSQA